MNQSILIIEDNPTILDLLKEIFNSANFSVTTATNGQDGLDLAYSQTYSAIILDLKMPHLDGLEFLQHLKTHPSPKTQGPIIVYSSVTYDYARRESLNRGAAAYLVKDQKQPSEILRTVQELISQSSPQPEP